ncbi:MAG: ABC transporter ATP-binding protein [archaeon]|nr:ABC transporter ATP-binding protein [archaeon]
MYAISVENLVKSYGDHQAVKGISFDVPEGSFFAFLGPNGAGKSTTISIISSLLKRDSGNVSIFGKEPSDLETKKNIGIVFQDPKLDKILTVRENVEVRGAFYGLDKNALKETVDWVLDITECREFADQRYGQLSGGQRRRADIARALVHRPRLLILDEPTTGLDPKTRMLIWNLINRLNRENGITILLTTHYMEEAAEADDIVIINRGNIVAHGTPNELREAHCSDRLYFVPSDKSKAIEVLADMNIEYTEDKERFVVKVKKTADAVPIITALGDIITSLEVRTGTLDEAFINITGEVLE